MEGVVTRGVFVDYCPVGVGGGGGVVSTTQIIKKLLNVISELMKKTQFI